MRIIALDLGIKTLGISISDEYQIIAIPQENYFFKEGEVNFPILKVKQYLQKYNVELILLGYPLKTTGEKATISVFIEEFEKRMIKLNLVQIKRIDERFSTKRARELIPKNKLLEFKNQKDLLASWVILTDYLNFKH